MQQITNASVTAYDDAYRTMLEKCSSLILPVLNEYQKYRIIFCARMVAEKLMEKYPNVRKEVIDVMGGKVVECEADWILQRGIQQGMQQGIQQGMQQGMQQGIQQMIEKMLRNHKTPEEIVDFCDCDLQEVKDVQEKMQED